MTEAFPLHWPDGWPRTPLAARESGIRFSKKRSDQAWGSRPTTFSEARDSLYDELAKLGANHPIVSSNHPPGRYGAPVEAKRRPEDDGIALYFTWNGKPMVMARDQFETAAANMRSLALAIEAMRQLERHGGGIMMERAFAGFVALPAPKGKKWHEVLGVSQQATAKEVETKYRMLAKELHPDTNSGNVGTSDAMAELNAARVEFYAATQTQQSA